MNIRSQQQGTENDNQVENAFFNEGSKFLIQISAYSFHQNSSGNGRSYKSKISLFPIHLSRNVQESPQ